MRVVIWGLVAVVFCYAFYAGAMAVWSYVAVASAIDEVLSAQPADEGPDPLQIQLAILQKANEAGVPLSDREVSVLVAKDRRLKISVVWSFPVFIVKGETVLAVPLSVARSVSVAGRR